MDSTQQNIDMSHAVMLTVYEHDLECKQDDIASVEDMLTPGWLDGCTVLEFTYTDHLTEDRLEMFGNVHCLLNPNLGPLATRFS